LKEEPINRSFERIDVTPATYVFGVVLLNSFQNIEKKRRVFEGLFIRESLSKKESLSLPVRRPAPFNRM
jgi:hypothetical protein